VPPGGAAFALEEGGARVLVASPQSTLVAWCLDIVFIKFSIVNSGKNRDCGGAEASCPLFLDLEVGEDLWGPVDEVLAQEGLVFSFAISGRGVCSRQGLLSGRRDVIDGRKLPREV
jgi:hypothetical protein